LWVSGNEGASTAVFRASQRTETEGKPSGTRQGTSVWADERHDAVHECMRRERRRNARARESVECWPEVREGLTYNVRMSMKRKQRGWVHRADRLGHERACA
jgi:hypothetical protein